MSILETADAFFRDRVAPVANQLDSDSRLLAQVMHEMGGAGLMSLRRPEEYGGPGLAEPEFRAYQEMVAATSGALSFLQTQHQSAVSMISKCPNTGLKERVLPTAHTPSGWIGIGFSQLRRPGPPLLKATKVEGGYVLNGHLPWLTGHTFFPRCLVGAQLPSGEAVFGLIPFKAQQGLALSEPMGLVAMQSALTVTGDMTDWFMDDGDVAFVQPPGWIQENDMVNVTLQAWFAIGCAKAGLAIVHQAYSKKQNDKILTAHDSLWRELMACRDAVAELDRPWEDRVRVRAQAIDLACRCAYAGVVATGGTAGGADHPAQRVFREALVYGVSAQTVPIMEATLDRLVGRG